jgi:ZIP family zinc transporter
MEAAEATRSRAGGVPAWLLGLGPLLIIIVAVALFAALGGPGLGERTGPPVEQLTIERTVLEPGTIELTVRNEGPDAVRVAQVSVNDAFSGFTGGEGEIGRLASEKLKIQYPWAEGERYQIGLLTSTGGTITHEIPIAVGTPDADAGFFGLMALLGIYVGVIPIAMGMLWLPWLRRIPAEWMRVLMALTVGLLAFLGIDALLEGLDIAGQGAQAFGGAILVLVGAAIAYLVLSAVQTWLKGQRVALLIALGIGLHNLGEGLLIGSAYSSGALALGAFLVIGFALHNTTEGLAIVAPLAAEKPSLAKLAGLGVLAGAPAVLGAWIGAAAYNPSAGSFLFGLGVGAIAQVVVQLWPTLRDSAGQALNPRSVAGLIGGMALMFGTGLLVTL